MLYKGRKIEAPNSELIIIPRGDGEDIVFTAQAVLDLESFEQLCPVPKPPRLRKPGNILVDDVEDAGYKAAVEEQNKRRMSYIIINSLRATKELVWETVNYSDAETWNNYLTELKSSGFTEIEVNRIIIGVLSANGLNEERVEQARKTFLLTKAEQVNNITSQTVEQNGTPFSEAVKELASSQ